MLRWFVKFSFAAVFIAALAASVGLAAADSGASVQSVAESYNADQPLQTGMIVKLKNGDASTVVPLDQNSISDMHGVVVPANDTPVTLAPVNPSGQQVYVATAGRFNVLVSTQNGSIKSGDYITISSLAGVGMKASGSQSIVLGKAAGSFDGTGNVEGSASLKGPSGQQVSVSIGSVPVDISIAHNPLAHNQAGLGSGAPGFLKNIGTAVTNRPVSAVRLYLALLVFIISAFIAGSLLYGGVRNGMVSIGRNPLAKKSIMRGMTQSVLFSLIVFVVGVFGVYLLLKL